MKATSPVDVEQTPLGLGLSARLNDITVVLFICGLGLATIVLLGVLVAVSIILYTASYLDNIISIKLGHDW